MLPVAGQQRTWNRVVMFVDFHVVIGMNSDFLHRGVTAGNWLQEEGFQCGFIKLDEEFCT